MFTDILERRIYNLEKRMKWIQRDISFYREMYKLAEAKDMTIPRKVMKVEQLEMFDRIG